MTIHVGEVTSDVVPVPEPGRGDEAEGATEERPWDALVRFRALRERARADAMRTAAEAFDD